MLKRRSRRRYAPQMKIHERERWQDLQHLMARWALRALLKGNGWRRLLDEDEVDTEDLADLFEVDLMDLRCVNRRDAKVGLSETLRALEAGPAPACGVVRGNVERLADVLGLSAVESEIVLFTVLLHRYTVFQHALSLLGELSPSDLYVVLAIMLECDDTQIAEALSPTGVLAITGAVRIDTTNWDYDLKDRLDLLAGLDAAVLDGTVSQERLFAAYLQISPPARHTLEDFPHVRRHLAVLVPFLKEALARREPGVNVLLYGPPGTGKTELVRAIAQALGVELREVPTESDDGRPLSGADRSQALRFAARLCARRTHCLLLFDEIEDYFDALAFDGERWQRGGGKGASVRLIETQPVPTFWITNSVEPIDAAFLRRFDVVLELGVPPPAVRARMLAAHLGELQPDPAWLARLARHADLAPGHIQRAARVVVLARRQAEEVAVEPALALVMESSLRAMHLAPLPVEAGGLAMPYSIACLNADTDLERLIAGLGRARSGRLCFYGPPGTGKSAFARHLADRLGLPVVEKRASDLLNPYLGVTESCIARMFHEAREQGAVLILDEADSFLRERARAHYAWEVTQVNELLTQIEAFPGLFIASTNLMDSLDDASLRRFDAKIRFDYLTAAQAAMLFRDVLAAGGASVQEAALPGDWRTRLGALAHLTPGDFAAVARRARFADGGLAAAALLEGLDAECAIKREVREAQPIGFTARLKSARGG